MALVTRNAIADGRAAAQLTTLGISAGLVTWAVASALGLAALLSASATAFLVVKVAGAVYLVLLGTQTILRAWRGVSSDPQPAATGTGRSWPGPSGLGLRLAVAER